MWLIVGTSPQIHKAGKDGLCFAPYSVENHAGVPHICLSSGELLPVERGTEALAASAWHAMQHSTAQAPCELCLLLAQDIGDGVGSRAVYARLIELLIQNRHKKHDGAKEMSIKGITFHYLFPDVDWHNRILMALEHCQPKPVLVADAGFMYVAKMSGYADHYDLFTPDIGELAFLADEKAPHPFYTRGFLLEQDNPDNVKTLLSRAYEHGNMAKHCIIKGSVDHLAMEGQIVARIPDEDHPILGVPAMEAIGGTGDLVTGFVTGFLAARLSMEQASLKAVCANRMLASHAQPTPATQVGELLRYVDAIFS